MPSHPKGSHRVEFRSMREGNLCGCTGESPETAPWAKRSFHPRIVTKGIGTTVQSIGKRARSMGYL